MRQLDQAGMAGIGDIDDLPDLLARTGLRLA